MEANMMKSIMVMLVFITLCAALSAEFEMGVAVRIDSTRSFPYKVSVQSALLEMKYGMHRAALQREYASLGGLGKLVKEMQVANGTGYDTDLAESLFMISSAAGYLLSEEVLKDTPRYPKGDFFNIKMEYLARVLPAAKAIPSAQKAEIRTVPANPKPGELYSLNVTPAQDGYLYIFEFRDDSTVRLLYPPDEGKNLIKKNTLFTKQLTAFHAPEQTKAWQGLLILLSKTDLLGWRKFLTTTEAPEHLFSQGQECYGLFKSWLPTYDAKSLLQSFLILAYK